MVTSLYSSLIFTTVFFFFKFHQMLQILDWIAILFVVVSVSEIEAHEEVEVKKQQLKD